MRVLLIKTSSLGDVIHALPALTDAARAIPGITFDWVVEEGFAEIPTWHPAVGKVIPVAIRRWRKNIWQTIKSGEWKRFKQSVRATKYDLVIDAQGLLKSALLTRYVKAPVAGLDKSSAREPIAARFYSRRLAVARGQHAVERVRQLFAIALGYDLPKGLGDYGLNVERLVELPRKNPYVVFLHGTTWDTKHWPEAYWRELAERVGYLGVGGETAVGQPDREGPRRAHRQRHEARRSAAQAESGGRRQSAGRRASLRGGGHRSRSSGRGAGRADAVAVRPDQPGPDRCLRQVADSPGQRFPLRAVPAKEMYLSTDGRRCPSVRP